MLAPAAVAVMLALPATCSAQGREVPGSGGPDQYVESLPGAEGNRPAGGGKRGGSDPLPARTRSDLRGDAEGRALERVATDSSLGAPRGDRDGRRDRSADGAGAAGGAVDDKSLPAVAADTVGDSGGLGWVVLAVMAGITALGAAVAVARLRRRRA